MWNDAVEWPRLSGGIPLYRGFSTRMDGASIQVSSPENRRPRSMPPEIQNQMDDWFEAKFGIRFRQRSLFTTGSIQTAIHYSGDYGEVRMIRPCAPFCFCWSPFCDDLYGAFEEKPVSESIEDLLTRLQFRCLGLDEALRTGHEIMMVGTAFLADTCERTQT